MPKNCIIIHGCPPAIETQINPKTRTYDKHWIPWAKKELGKLYIKTAAPLMPTPWAPDYEKYKKKFDKLPVNKNTILIGHSCGCNFLVHWLGETKRSINKLILVAPWKADEQIGKKEWPFYVFPIDKTIKNRVKEIIIFTSNTEYPAGKRGAAMFGQALDAQIISLKNHGHYVFSHMGTNEFPELIKAVSK